MKNLLKTLVVATGLLASFLMINFDSQLVVAQDENEEVIRLGIIGLDTSHAPAFVKEFNSEPASDDMKNCRVVAAYPYGSRDIESSYSRIPKYTVAVQDRGVEVLDSIEEMLQGVDGVLLETNDGKPHLEQALKVFRAGKPVFIDKPVGSNLAEVIAIFRAAEHYNTPVFSSSSLRYLSAAQRVRNNEHGDVIACDAFSPCSMEPSHVDLFWYGIHGVEILFTCMGTGCETVSHISSPRGEFAVGRWSDGRIGTFRGLSAGKSGFGGTAFTSKSIVPLGTHEGYRSMLIQIASFFRDGVVPVSSDETIEIYAFMQAAFESKNSGGASVRIADVIAKAEREATILLNGKLE